ncbi:MAG: aspartate ammonia-lyase [Ruminococcaceae bacterium]|nr:aspartate ammonia-lyase [Oscillospiraceae bacterium]
MINYREEQDSIGKKQVPADAYYGVQTLRASENFKITREKTHPEFVKSIVEIKLAAAITNRDAGVIDSSVADAIIEACKEILDGDYSDSFIVDALQGGAGTSLNMNANEVIANRAIEILGGQKGNYTVVHPNDHVNCGQSTNDVYPSAGKIALIRLLKNAMGVLHDLHTAFVKKSEQFNDIIKMGRTEMQDAVPISFGQLFGAYASAVERDINRFKIAIDEMSKLNMGGTAIGTGINADQTYIKQIVPQISKITGLKLHQAKDLVDATQNLDSFVYVSGIIKSCATTVSKISNDIRLMSSGPRTGFNEINIPAMQNGSSIMPGKINPVIPEVMNQIAFNVIGNDTTITHAAEAGQLELNAFEPVIFYCLFQSLDTLTNGIRGFISGCIDGITVNIGKCQDDVERSIGIITALCPSIGYTEASNIAKRALKEGKKIRDIIISENLVSDEELDVLLNPYKMI